MKPGDFGEDCLSAQREFRSRPALSANRGQSEGPVQWGALLFGYFLLGKQEKVTCRRATPGLTIQKEMKMLDFLTWLLFITN